VFRFLTEFLRETPKAYGELSAYQLMSLAMIVAGAVAIIARTLHQPASWEKWKIAGRAAA
jgi:prolipoprotein diacylglyceryltransferase